MNDLPLPGERDLPPGRHLALKEHLMDEIRRTEPAPAPAPAATRRKWRRPVVLGPAVAFTLVIALAVGIGLGSIGDSGTTVEPAGPGHEEAVELLEKAALAAEQSDLRDGLRDSQYIYTEHRVAWFVGTDGVPGLEPLRDRATWMGRAGGMSSENLHEEDIRSPDDPEDDLPPLHEYAVRALDMRLLGEVTRLPTEPDAMLERLRTEADRLNATAGEEDLDHAVFLLVSDLSMETLPPPEVGAALYRALAQLPGVFVVPDSEDAAERTGLAVAHVDKQGVRDELIFHEETFEVLGERRIVLEDGEIRKTTALLERAIVNTASERTP